MISFPNAKINLGLNIIEKREDDYHNISSCFYPIPLKDVLEINVSKTFSFQQTGISIPGDKLNNLVVKAYKLLKKDFNLPNVSIHLHKNIPLEAGLGGGSSDGAFTLHMLNEYFDLFLNDTIVCDYAEKLGSDCPFFIYNEPKMVSGRGEEMVKIDLKLKDYFIYIIKPDISMSTKVAYRDIVPAKPPHNIHSILTESAIGSWEGLLKNDFEEVMLNIHPEVSQLKTKLYELGAMYASMTGSGSAFFGIFKDPPISKGIFPEHYFSWTGEL